ncbi:YtxH domain-containing protein [Pedobacter sp. SYSU D00535]|uniref:YtxH domain-containing protein n=1 Tax=Pedobacter sp. SYSU D00535 TaxID=2810308 RepID=UPI001A968F83|nr:YtxH domain-containing protein [Pedobacter sp. SYSU D00535]
MNDNTKVLLALLAGAAAGAALGILFAPEKGSETRDRLNDALKNLSDTIKDRAAEEIENLTAFKDKVVDEVKTRFASSETEGFDQTQQQQAPVAEQI